MDATTCLLVSGLADDHAAAREALTAAATLALGPAAVVIEPAMPPATGFALVLATPEPVTADDLAKLRHALELELQKREVMHADLAVELLPEAEG